jgi:hypothetical protein
MTCTRWRRPTCTASRTGERRARGAGPGPPGGGVWQLLRPQERCRQPGRPPAAEGLQSAGAGAPQVAPAAQPPFHPPARPPRRFQLSYYPVTDEGIFEPHVLAARTAKETTAVAAWRLERERVGIHSLRELHAWLHGTHLCYSVSRQHEFGQPTELSAELASSY